eukprot:TRINITY_DN11364_c0_g1_i2.p1 TRINITY_DN11364_c0_g1~~TRINITY_DN11364_c0_g1_i2.p1  ORF type:complete len:1024 (+),score=358.42 TRINITY_DN11364_c0_g1_i2:149-3220(+)
MRSRKEGEAKFFTKPQRREIYEMILESIDGFMETNSSELALLKNIVSNYEINEFLVNLRFLPGKEKQEMGSLKSGKNNGLRKPLAERVIKPTKRYPNKKLSTGESHEAPITSPQKMLSRNTRVTQTTRDVKGAPATSNLSRKDKKPYKPPRKVSAAKELSKSASSEDSLQRETSMDHREVPKKTNTHINAYRQNAGRLHRKDIHNMTSLEVAKDYTSNDAKQPLSPKNKAKRVKSLLAKTTVNLHERIVNTEKPTPRKHGKRKRAGSSDVKDKKGPKLIKRNDKKKEVVETANDNKDKADHKEDKKRAIKKVKKEVKKEEQKLEEKGDALKDSIAKEHSKSNEENLDVSQRTDGGNARDAADHKKGEEESKKPKKKNVKKDEEEPGKGKIKKNEPPKEEKKIPAKVAQPKEAKKETNKEDKGPVKEVKKDHATPKKDKPEKEHPKEVNKATNGADKKVKEAKKEASKIPSKNTDKEVKKEFPKDKKSTDTPKETKKELVKEVKKEKGKEVKKEQAKKDKKKERPKTMVQESNKSKPEAKMKPEEPANAQDESDIKEPAAESLSKTTEEVPATIGTKAENKEETKDMPENKESDAALQEKVATPKEEKENPEISKEQEETINNSEAPASSEAKEEVVDPILGEKVEELVKVENAEDTVEVAKEQTETPAQESWPDVLQEEPKPVPTILEEQKEESQAIAGTIQPTVQEQKTEAAEVSETAKELADTKPEEKLIPKISDTKLDDAKEEHRDQPEIILEPKNNEQAVIEEKKEVPVEEPSKASASNRPIKLSELQSLEHIMPQANPNYFFPPEMVENLKKPELSADALLIVIQALKEKETELQNEIINIEINHSNCSEPVDFDIGIKDTFLEIDQEDEAKLFYDLEAPSPETLLTVKILAGALGRWELIDQEPEVTWINIKSYFKEEMKERVSGYFLEAIREKRLDFSKENLFRLKLLMQGHKLDEEAAPKDSGLVSVLYIAIIDVLARTMGLVEEGKPYFVWSELTYEVEILKAAIEELTNAIKK